MHFFLLLLLPFIVGCYPTRATLETERAYQGPEDLEWLEGLETLVLRELPNFNLSADMLADKLNISRPTFFRKVKHLTGLTVQQYIAEARYRTARAGLEHGRYTSVKSASLSVGLRDVEHFAAQFKERFGNPPSNYIKN